MSNKKALVVLTIFVLFALSFVSLAEGKIAVVFATGGLGDQSFNDAAYRGINLAETELGIEYNYAEPAAIAEFETYLTQFAASRSYDLIISIGFDQADALTNVAERFPEQKFALVDSVVDMPNVASFVFAEEERGFLMGVASAMMTDRSDDSKINEDNKIAVIGGMKIPLIDANIAGFYAGAEYVNPEIEVNHSYVGDWADPARGKELALSMMEDGADIIWGAAGRSGLGVIMAAEEEDRYAIGADSDQSHLAPEHVLTNGMKFVDNTVLLAVEQVINDEFTPGTNVLGVKDDALGYTASLLPEDIIEKLDEVIEEIINSEIEIPSSLD